MKYEDLLNSLFKCDYKIDENKFLKDNAPKQMGIPISNPKVQLSLDIEKSTIYQLIYTVREQVKSRDEIENKLDYVTTNKEVFESILSLLGLHIKANLGNLLRVCSLTNVNLPEDIINLCNKFKENGSDSETSSDIK